MQPKSIDRAVGGIKITWQDGRVDAYRAKFLRRMCPCAVCREIPGWTPQFGVPLNRLPTEEISIKTAQPVGWYALQFVFSDGHDTGIYSYEMLRKIGSESSGPLEK